MDGELYSAFSSVSLNSAAVLNGPPGSFRCFIDRTVLDWSYRQVHSGGDMTSISFYDARTHFSELLDQVARGKTVLITRRGNAWAVLGPPPAEAARDIREVLGAMKALRRSNTLGEGVSIRDLIHEGAPLLKRGKWRKDGGMSKKKGKAKPRTFVLDCSLTVACSLRTRRTLMRRRSKTPWRGRWRWRRRCGRWKSLTPSWSGSAAAPTEAKAATFLVSFDPANHDRRRNGYPGVCESLHLGRAHRCRFTTRPTWAGPASRAAAGYARRQAQGRRGRCWRGGIHAVRSGRVIGKLRRPKGGNRRVGDAL